ncbi:MAG TPA: PQQ-binding-like beta-propeller repeat protein [Kofleriaceae bacterium]|nr:PQQ-binding-like beta-propeller repeat protein [Kofleriaceae bacterium]
MKPAWHVKLDILVDAVTANKDVFIATALKTMVGLDVNTGRQLWRRDVHVGTGRLQTTRRGPVILDNQKGVSTLRAFDWTGTPRWSLRRDWSFPGDGFIVEADRILCAGIYNDSRECICACVDDVTGLLLAEYACPGVQPRSVTDGFMYRGDYRPGAPDEIAGLFHVTVSTGQVKRISTLPVEVFQLAGDTAVVISGEDPTARVTAIDTVTGEVRWSHRTNYSCDLAIDGDDVVSGVWDGENITVCLRSLRDGSVRWTAPPIRRSSLGPVLLTPTLVVAYGAVDDSTSADSHLVLHDRASGRVLQKIDKTGFVGGVTAGPNLIDVQMGGSLTCWRT